VAARSLLFHVSDVHFGAEDEAALAWFAAAVRKERPDGIVCTGDLTQRATHRQYREAQEWFAGLPAPLMVQPGNHDMPYYNLWERVRRPYRRFGALEAAVGGTLEHEDWVVIALDTNAVAQWRWPWSDGVVSERKLDRTLDRLRELRGDPRMKLIACHHPLLPTEGEARNPTIRGEKAFAALAREGADAVLTGHVHRPFDRMRASGNRAIRMIGAGTLSTRLRGAVPSYNVLTIVNGELTIEQRNLPK
jgi:3',5'-cyclic AMP phosphodiesterase CpdA